MSGHAYGLIIIWNYTNNFAPMEQNNAKK